MTTNSISYLGVKCPTGLPIAERANCFFHNGEHGNCENCLYPVFREKIEADERDMQDMVRTMREEYRKVGGSR